MTQKKVAVIGMSRIFSLIITVYRCWPKRSCIN